MRDRSVLWEGQVSNFMAGVYALGVPIIFFVMQSVASLFVKSWRSDLRDSLLGFVFCIGLNATVTEYFKVNIGRPRPNHLALVCNAMADSADADAS